MISIGRLRAGAAAADYYLTKQAGCDLDYYTGAGESHGRWLGDGARALGLDGTLVDAGEALLRGLLSGCGPDGQRLVAPVLRADPRGLLDAAPLIRALESADPREGVELLGAGKAANAIDAAAATVRLGRPATLPADLAGRAATAAGLDPVALYRGVDGGDAYTAALPFVDAKVDVRRAGLDVTVSAPKSVSLLFGLGAPEVAAAARAAHAIAVGEVVAYLQRHGATAARGHQGGGQRAARIASDGLIVAAFDHRTSRAGDPQLHTHLVVPNLIRGVDGRWSAMDTAAFYRHARTASSLYHAVLRGELTRTLGVGWAPVRNGIAEIAGVDRPVIETFSKRRAQIVAATSKRGVRGAKAAQLACLLTRPAKAPEQPATLRARWRAEAVGIDSELLQRLVGVAALPDEPAVELLARRLFGPGGVTAQRTTFTRQDLAQALCDALPAGTPVRLTDIDRLVTALVAHSDVLPVVTDAAERRYTTRELVTTEQRALALATSPTARPIAALDRDTVTAVLARSGLSDEQHAMVAALLTGGRRVDVVAGPAGAGKTVALATAAELWSQAGAPVRGATVSWLAARNLHAATGIPSRSLASTLRAAERHGLPAGVVLVLDEASLVKTRTLAQLLEHVHAVDGKLVCVGDPAQLPEIGAGGIFATLAARDDTIRLSDNRRQQQPWERDALRRLRDGDTTSALDAYIDHGRVHTARNTRTLLDIVADDYLTAIDAGEQVLVLAARRVDVTRLNAHIRHRLIEAGRLGADEFTVRTANGDRSFRVGDQVLITANDRELGLVNGTRGAITAIHPRRGNLQVHCDDGRDVVLDRDWLTTGPLHHGYAATVHKAQGLTVDTTLIYGAGPLTHEHAYVALSRGRAANHLYLAADSLDNDQCEPGQHRGEEPALVAELLERITISGAHQLASTQLAQPWHPPAHDPYDDDHLQRMHHYDPPDRGYGLGR